MRSSSDAIGALLFAASIAMTAGLATHARADGVADEAELHFQIGIDNYRDGDYRGALEHFLASHRLAPNRNVVYNIARAYERIGNLTNAYRYYVDALDGETDEAQLNRIREALMGLAPRVAIIDVETTPPGATLYLDRIDLGAVGIAPRTLVVAPGEHTVIVQHPGFVEARSTALTLGLGSHELVRLTLTPIVGTIDIGGDPGVEARLDTDEGPAACIVPCSIEARPGPHEVQLTRPGFAVVVRQVLVEANTTSAITASLSALTGSLLVSADETNALVEVDGRAAGFTPTVIRDMPVGTHRVRVSLAGYEAYEAEVEVTENEETRIDDVRLDPVRSVTAASRRTESLDDAPASVSVVSAPELEAFGYPTISEALRGLRGVALTDDTAYSNVSLRGIGQPNDYSNRLLLLSDGATLNDDVLYQAFMGFDGRVDLGDVERIELVRGPGSVLYGTGAVSGVVNLVPHSRDVRTHARFSLGAAYNSVGRLRAGMALRLGDDSGVEASVSGARSGGRDVTLDFDSNGDGIAEPNTAREAESFWALSTVGRAWHEALTVQWMFSFRDQGIPTGAFDTIYDRTDNRYDDRRGMLEVRFEPQLEEHFQLLTRAYANMYFFDSTLFYDSGEVDPGTGQALEQIYSEDYLSFWFGAEARGVWTPVDQLRLTVGADVNHHPLVQINIGQTEIDGSDTRFFDGNRPFTVYAGYALADWEPVREVRISAGVRVDGWDLFQDLEDFVAVNPRLAVIFRPSEMDTLKLMGGRAFRAPTMYEFYYTDGTTQAPSDCCGTRPSSEQFTSAEIEYTHRFDQDWSALVSAHGTYAESFIETADAPDDSPYAGQVYYRNSDVDQYVLGGDVEVRRELRGGWMFAAQYGYLEARYLTTPDGAVDDRVPNAPNPYGSVRTVVPFVDRLLVGALRATVEAPRRIDTGARDRSDFGVVADFVLSGYVSEFGIRYNFGVYNLFDWQIALPVSPFPSRTLPQRGRTFYFSFELTL
ncbi:MAG: TonB-dependent receptor [Sandaracinaceae bacterium]